MSNVSPKFRQTFCVSNVSPKFRQTFCVCPMYHLSSDRHFVYPMYHPNSDRHLCIQCITFRQKIFFTNCVQFRCNEDPNENFMTWGQINTINTLKQTKSSFYNKKLYSGLTFIELNKHPNHSYKQHNFDKRIDFVVNIYELAHNYCNK